MAKDLPAKQETWVQSLGWEDPPEKGMQPTPVFLPGKFHGQRSLVGLHGVAKPHGATWGCKRVRHDLETKQQTSSKGHPMHLKQDFLST